MNPMMMDRKIVLKCMNLVQGGMIYIAIVVAPTCVKCHRLKLTDFDWDWRNLFGQNYTKTNEMQHQDYLKTNSLISKNDLGYQKRFHQKDVSSIEYRMAKQNN